MRKLALLVLILGLVACGGDDGEASGGMSGAGGSAGEAGEGGSTGGSSGEGGESGEGGVGGDSGEGGESGEGGTGGSAPVVVPLAEVPAEFAGAICDALEDCVGTRKLSDIAGGEDCKARFTAELEAGELAHIDDSISAGRVLYNPDQLAECLEGIRGMGCDVVTDTYPEACVEVIAGNVGQGEECAISSECEGTAFCAGRLECPSTCQPLLAEGDECLSDDECGDDLVCDGTCIALAGEGDDCGGNSGVSCMIGLACINFTAEEPGTCTPNAEVLAGEVDDACDPTGTLCEEGLSCVPVSADPEEWRCREAVGADDACLLAIPGMCPAGYFCNATEFFAEGTCEALPEDGETCVLTQRICAPGFACVLEGEEPICRAIAENGETCTGDAACRSGNCTGGECAPPAICE